MFSIFDFSSVPSWRFGSTLGSLQLVHVLVRRSRPCELPSARSTAPSKTGRVSPAASGNLTCEFNAKLSCSNESAVRPVSRGHIVAAPPPSSAEENDATISSGLASITSRCMSATNLP